MTCDTELHLHASCLQHVLGSKPAHLNNSSYKFQRPCGTSSPADPESEAVGLPEPWASAQREGRSRGLDVQRPAARGVQESSALPKRRNRKRAVAA
eukprot:CAMPEP_0183483576 /NCGR_PEP_ID=MMETSP0370-20130417/178480_1 /TAXON_ID=268820 /ORGANISM="Peridinium aciculiferum, Strain PAER-2" /LENGTH=95 /DNA_ID=CAMNT_0025676849 /DNA_START=8 /DNA_END=291 /DNA_ORIENTATION=+